MAIRDLLWACPQCGAEAGIEPGRRGVEICRACATHFRRGRGATIVAETDAGQTVRTPAKWLARLPTIRPPEAGATRTAAVLIRKQTGQTPVRQGEQVLGFRETFGEPMAGALRLTRERLGITTQDGEREEWPLDRIGAVQSSSSTLQVRPRGEPLHSLRFQDASVRYWEILVQETLRSYYRAHGMGTIAEFQPRIVTVP